MQTASSTSGCWTCSRRTTSAGSSTTAATIPPTPRNKVSKLAAEFDYPLICIGVPKTVDNDLAVTDCCPGFGSAAKYTAVSVRECRARRRRDGRDLDQGLRLRGDGPPRRLAGRRRPGSPGRTADDAPHLILFPERPYDEADFLASVQTVVDRVGYCVVVASEGIQTADGRFVADAGGGKDSFGHTQLGGVASFLAGRVKDQLGMKVHWTLPDYLQRSARHLASQDRPRPGAGGRQGRGRVRARRAATPPCR